MTTPREQWIDAYNWFGLYEVSNLGNVRNSKTKRIMKGFKDQKGYLCVLLSGKEKPYSVKRHKLVIETFIEPRPKGMVINHIDKNKENNKIENLEYVTQMENVSHSSVCGNLKGITYLKSQNSWQSRITINGKRIFLGYFKTKEDAYNAYKKALKDNNLENKYAK